MHDNGNQEPAHGATPRPRLFVSLKAAIETRHYSRRAAAVAGRTRACQAVDEEADGADGGRSSRTSVKTARNEMVDGEPAVRGGPAAARMPDALARKYPRAPYEWTWKFVFPSYKRSADRETGVIRRHHVYENYLICEVKQAARAARRSPLPQAGLRLTSRGDYPSPFTGFARRMLPAMILYSSRRHSSAPL